MARVMMRNVMVAEHVASSSGVGGPEPSDYLYGIGAVNVQAGPRVVLRSTSDGEDMMRTNCSSAVQRAGRVDAGHIAERPHENGASVPDGQWNVLKIGA
jgi:hypothetical protein